MMRHWLSAVPTKRDWILPLTMAFLSLMFSAYANYNHTDKNIAVQLGEIKTQQTADEARIDRTQLDASDDRNRIEHKIDNLDAKVDRLLERLAAGHPGR